MFWKILFWWTIGGMGLELITYLCLGIYAAWREDMAGVTEDETFQAASKITMQSCFEKHCEWSGWMYKILPWFLAGAIEACWRFIVWPLEIPLAIRHIKEAIDNMYLSDVNKAS